MGGKGGNSIDRRGAIGLGASAIAAVGLTACSAGGSENAPETPDAVGIIGAMESEVESIRKAMEDTKSTTIAGMEFTEGKLGDNRAVVVQCGMGKVNAGICAQVLITSFGATRIINAGVGGGLTDELSIGDFVVSVDAVQHDFDVEPIGFKRGEIPFTGKVSFEADEKLRAMAVEAVKQAAPTAKVIEGRICSGDQFIDTPEKIAAITTNFGGVCAEMEGAAIAQVCYLNEIPFVIIRAISDGGDDEDYESFQERVAAECATVAIEMTKSL